MGDIIKRRKLPRISVNWPVTLYTATGEVIIWNGSHGFGVAFDTSEPDFSKLKASLAARCLF